MEKKSIVLCLLLLFCLMSINFVYAQNDVSTNRQVLISDLRKIIENIKQTNSDSKKIKQVKSLLDRSLKLLESAVRSNKPAKCGEDFARAISTLDFAIDVLIDNECNPFSEKKCISPKFVKAYKPDLDRLLDNLEKEIKLGDGDEGRIVCKASL